MGIYLIKKLDVQRLETRKQSLEYEIERRNTIINCEKEKINKLKIEIDKAENQLKKLK